MSFPNHYTHRKVAETSARGCEICFKPSTSVLITPENKDFFYVCPSHLKDRGFCTPKIDQAAIEARKKKELEEEVARVKEEYEEKQKKKKEKEKEKDTEKSKDEKGGKKSDADKKGEKKDNKAESESKSEANSPPPEAEEPREFELKNTFFQQRVNKKRQAEMAKRNRERMQDPNFFPSVPKGPP